MGEKFVESLGRQPFYLTTYTDEGGRVSGYSIDIERAEDSHYTFTPEAMSTLDEYLTTRHTGATLVGRLTQFVASFPAFIGVEAEIRELDRRLGLGMKQFHFDNYDQD